MIYKLLINNDNKLLYYNFIIDKINNKIIITSTNNISNINIPIYNKYNSLNYYNISLPLELLIYNNNIINPYIIISSYHLDIENEIDFFYQLKKIIFNNYNLKFYDFDYFINNNSINLIKIITKNYNKLFINNNISITKLYTLYYLIKNNNVLDSVSNNNLSTSVSNNNVLNSVSNTNNNKFNKKKLTLKDNIDFDKYLSKDILNFINIFKNYKYNINNDYNSQKLVFIDYYNNTNLPLELKYIIINNNYYIESNANFIIKINIININNNNITFTDDLLKNNVIKFENYKWYYYYPKLNINKSYIIYQTFINNDFTDLINKYIFNIDENNHNINDFDNDELFINKIIKDPDYFKNMVININKLNTLENNTNTNETNEFNNIFKILSILFNHYNYPFKINRNEIDNIFDYILYISLYNYKLIFNDELINTTIFNIIPIKVKNLYINILKILIQIINNKFDFILNPKFYTDYLHKNIIKNIFSNTNKLFINYFKELTKNNFIKFKELIINNYIIFDIFNKLNWNNISKKFYYLTFIYNNISLVNNKLTKNIFFEVDNKIKKIIENPFDMYKYLITENDFIIWSNFINNKLIDIYYIPITLIINDYKIIGKLLYLLFNISEQSINNKYYIYFIEFCNKNYKLILYNNRINIKIKELFPNIKCNLNLGILAKHLTWNKELIYFDNNVNKSKINNNINSLKVYQDNNNSNINSNNNLLEYKLYEINNKYLKYKKKYIKYKEIYLINLY